MIRALVILVVIITAFSCDETETGCIDTFATNYNVFAIDACKDSCCRYPQVSLSTSFVYDTFDQFSIGAYYPYNKDDSVRIRSLQLSFSDFTFYEESDGYTIEDTVRNISPRLHDDFVVLSTSSRSPLIGTLRKPNNIDSLSFRIGYDSLLVKGLEPFDELSSTSELSDLIGDMYVDSIDVLFQMRIDVEIGDSTRAIELTEIDPFLLSLPLDTAIVQGFNWSVPIIIDLLKVIDGVDSPQTDKEMQHIIKSNIRDAIGLR